MINRVLRIEALECRRLLATVPIDTSNRAAVVMAYANEFKPYVDVPVEWNGNVAGCVAGSVSEQSTDATLHVLNFLRNLAGTESVGLDEVFTHRAQEAALMMQAQNSLSHSPGTEWACYSEAGALGAGASNLYLGTTGPKAMVGYVEDPGSGNYPVGHRRWLLNPNADRMGIGSTSNANALYVIGANINRPSPTWISWPPKGYVPKELVFPRWSLSRSGANFTNATVQMTIHGQSVPVDLQPVVNGFAQNTLVWEPNTVLDMVSAEELTVDVRVENVLVDGVNTTFQYSVTPIQPGPPVRTVVSAEDDRFAIRSGLSSFYFDVLANDDLAHSDWAPATKDTLSAVIVGNPSHGSLLRAVGNPGIFFYYPNPGFTGVDTFSYRVADLDSGRVSNLATVQITVESGASLVNQPPTISSIANQPTTAGNVTQRIPFSVFDAETQASNLVIRATSANQTLIPNQSITIEGNGTNRSVLVKPAAGQTGAETITVWVSDGQNTTFESFVVRVGSNQNSPVLRDSLTGTYWGRPLGIDALKQVTSLQPAIDPNSLQIITAAKQGSLVMLGGGQMEYVANTGFVGEDRIEFTMRDVDGQMSNVASITIRVVGSALQNPLMQEDVNLDESVSALDALLIINAINAADGPFAVEGTSKGPPFHDVSGDQSVSALDALLVINHLNRPALAGSGEPRGSLDSPKNLPSQRIVWDQYLGMPADMPETDMPEPNVPYWWTGQVISNGLSTHWDNRWLNGEPIIRDWKRVPVLPVKKSVPERLAQSNVNDRLQHSSERVELLDAVWGKFDSISLSTD